MALRYAVATPAANDTCERIVTGKDSKFERGDTKLPSPPSKDDHDEDIHTEEKDADEENDDDEEEDGNVDDEEDLSVDEEHVDDDEE